MPSTVEPLKTGLCFAWLTGSLSLSGCPALSHLFMDSRKSSGEEGVGTEEAEEAVEEAALIAMMSSYACGLRD